MSAYSNRLWTKPKEGDTIPIRRWLWLSYLRMALIPLLVIELTFLGIYWASNALVYHENISAIKDASQVYLNDVARREATASGWQLQVVTQATGLFARQTARALDGSYVPPQAERARYARTADGAVYTRYGKDQTASFYSGISPVGDAQMQKVWHLAALDPLMIDIKNNYPSVSSVYINTNDSYNRIYPYMDGIKQYPAKMDIPSYNFYYAADAAHNPRRQVVWTDAYIDPAGHGWMVSSIAPVWRGDKLEAVVGIDLTLTTIIDHLLSLDLPKGAYAVVVDRKGGIVAMPPQGERDLGLHELTSYSYSHAIKSDSFKPEAFNFLKRAGTRALGEAILAHDHGQVRVQFNGPHQASFSRIPGLGWTLVIFAPESRIFAQAYRMKSKLNLVGLTMIGLLLTFYLIFFVYLSRRATVMSERISSPIGRLTVLLNRIGAGEYRQEFAGSPIGELDELGHRLVDTGNQLADAHELIVRHEGRVGEALAQQRQMNVEQGRLIRTMSHELRTPMAVIDSSARIIERRAAALSPDELQARAGRLRGAVGRMVEILSKLTRSLNDQVATETPEAQAEALDALVTRVALEVIPQERLNLSFIGDNPVVMHGPIIAIVLGTVLDNALRYSHVDKCVSVTATGRDGEVVITVFDEGEGILADELDRVGQRFFRGSNTGAASGAGVGLFVARKLIGSIGGELKIDCPGGGTTVTIRIPLNGADQPAPLDEDVNA